jgi:hypothetical protein
LLEPPALPPTFEPPLLVPPTPAPPPPTSPPPLAELDPPAPPGPLELAVAPAPLEELVLGLPPAAPAPLSSPSLEQLAITIAEATATTYTDLRSKRIWGCILRLGRSLAPTGSSASSADEGFARVRRRTSVVYRSPGRRVEAIFVRLADAASAARVGNAPALGCEVRQRRRDNSSFRCDVTAV